MVLLSTFAMIDKLLFWLKQNQRDLLTFYQSLKFNATQSISPMCHSRGLGAAPFKYDTTIWGYLKLKHKWRWHFLCLSSGYKGHFYKIQHCGKTCVRVPKFSLWQMLEGDLFFYHIPAKAHKCYALIVIMYRCRQDNWQCNSFQSVRILEKRPVIHLQPMACWSRLSSTIWKIQSQC